MKTDTYEYTVAENWLSAIINGDYTGLSDEEETLLNDWLDANQEMASHWTDGEDLGFARCEITGLMSDCIKLIQHVNYRG